MTSSELVLIKVYTDLTAKVSSVRTMCFLHKLGGLCPCRSQTYDVSGEEQRMGEESKYCGLTLGLLHLSFSSDTLPRLFLTLQHTISFLSCRVVVRGFVV